MQFAYRIHRCGLWVLLLALSSHSHAAGYYGGGGYVDADIGLRYESNLSRANEGKDIEEDMVTALSAGAGYLKILDDSSQLLISAYLAHERFAEFKDLNNVAINTAMVYTIQPHRAYTDPWYKFSADVSRRQFTESNIRDSYIVSAAAGAGKRVTDRIIALGFPRLAIALNTGCQMQKSLILTITNGKHYWYILIHQGFPYLAITLYKLERPYLQQRLTRPYWRHLKVSPPMMNLRRVSVQDV